MSSPDAGYSGYWSALLLMMLLLSTIAGCKETPSALDTSLQFSEATQEANLEYSGPSYTASVADVNDDGWPDIAVSQHQQLMLYLNRTGLFTPSLLSRGDIHGLAWLDWNNDALPDLYVSRGGGRGRRFGRDNLLLVNREGELVLTKLDGPALNSEERGRSATPWDIDNDGLLDLFILNFKSAQRLIVGTDRSQDVAEALGWRDIKAKTMRATHLQADSIVSYLTASNSGGQILRFDHKGRLADVTQQLGVEFPVATEVSAVVPFDFDNDGDQDLYFVLASDDYQGVRRIGKRIYFRFDHVGQQLGGLSIRASGRISLAIWAEGRKRHTWGRFGNGESIESYPMELNTNDERLRASVEGTDSTEPRARLWRDDDGLIKLDFRLERQRLQSVTGWIDLQKGGGELLEVYGVSGSPAGRANRLFMNENGLFVDVTEQSGTGDTGVGQDALSADFDHDGDLDLYVLNGRDIFVNPPNVLYENLGDGRFRVVTAEANAEGTPLGRGASVLDFDYDRDGDLDLFITNGSGPAPGNDGPVQLLRNDSITGHWLQVNLRTVQSNTMALGARLTLETPGLRQTREVTAATGKVSVSWQPIHFGMADASEGTLTVDWPGGLRSVHRVEANQFVTVTEPDS